MIILGIESSCDDTSVALLCVNDNKPVILAQKTASQIDIHKKYGGVVPEIAGRKHAEAIVPLIEAVMEGRNKPDVIAVTSGPGLITGLLVGVEAAKNLSYLWGVPLVRVNHIEGHIYSVILDQGTNSARQSSTKKIDDIMFPAVCLIVSGGHTELLLMKDHGEYELIGKTLDDAAGEAFDKVAKMLHFDYPGGSNISKHAKSGNVSAIHFPRPMLDKDTFDFSFAGLKTSALYWLRDNKLSAVHVNPLYRFASWFGMAGEGVTVSDFCASFEQAVVDVLVAKTVAASRKYNAKTVILAGGVSANTKLRAVLSQKLDTLASISNLLCPTLQYCMDNAAMIGLSGYVHARTHDYTPWRDLHADPNWKVYGTPNE